MLRRNLVGGGVAAAQRSALADPDVARRIEVTGGRVANADEAGPAGFADMLAREAAIARQVIERARISLD